MDDPEWGSVWATPATPANQPVNLTSPDENGSDTAKTPPASNTQTLSFVDDAFDDKSGPPTPAAFDPPLKSTALSFDTDDAFDVQNNDFDPSGDDGFGDFDDFAAPTSGQAMDDDFGDFGDFGTGEAGGGFETAQSNGFGEEMHAGFGQDGFGVENVKAQWQPLVVDPLPPPQELAEQVEELLRPLWENLRLDEFLSDEPERQVEGIAQILVNPESRELYGMLSQPPRGSSRPPTWTRSRIRRQHLISLGIPVNLDEVLPQAALKPLPVLHIQTETAHLPRPLSAPPGPRPGEPLPGRSAGTGSARGSRTGTPAGSPVSSAGRRLPPTASSALRLGPKPQIDNKKIEESLSMTHDNLSLLPLAQLESQLTTMRTLTSSTSALLSHLLQQREALQQDSETYNGLIAELVGEAQKMKSGGSRGRTGAIKRGSLM